jgi:hypothetical protein
VCSSDLFRYGQRNHNPSVMLTNPPNKRIILLNNIKSAVLILRYIH